MTTVARAPSRRRAQGPKTPQFTRNMAPGIHALHHAQVNCYLLEEDDELTIVDAGLPATWPLMQRAIRALGRGPRDVRALLLTHGHAEHVGFAQRAHEEWGVPIWVHAGEAKLLAKPRRYAHEAPRLMYPIQYPASIPGLLETVRAGALRVPGITGRLHHFEPGDVLDVPGHPTVVYTPGHTFGHCSFWVPDRSTLLTGDALVTRNPHTGGEGPQIVSGASTADSAEALRSLLVLAETDARLVLPAHGQPWRAGIRSAVELALRAGPS